MDGISCIPLLAGFCQPAIFSAQCDDGGPQIISGMNFVEARRILQRPAIFRRKFCYIRVAQALHRGGE